MSLYQELLMNSLPAYFQGLYKWTNGDSYTGDWRDGVPQVRQKTFRISSTCTFVVCCHFPFIPNYSYIGLLPFKLWDIAKVTVIVIVLPFYQKGHGEFTFGGEKEGER